MNRLSLYVASAMACLGASMARATPLTFVFSFADSNTPAMTVTGTIFGLGDNATGSATDIVINSYSPLYAAYLPPGPLDFMPAIASASANTFTVANGQITSAQFQGSMNLPNDTYVALQLEPGTGQFGFPGYFVVEQFDDEVSTIDQNGSTLAYAPQAVTAVPEPSSALTVLSGLALAALVQRRTAAPARTRRA